MQHLKVHCIAAAHLRLANAPCRWIDPKAFLNYEHWGNWTDDVGLPEPNNLYGGEYCGGANSTEKHNGAYGWSDVTCSKRGAFMCKVIRKRPSGSELGAALQAIIKAGCNALPACAAGVGDCTTCHQHIGCC